jgi:cell division protein FtsW (lipid II flippase)
MSWHKFFIALLKDLIISLVITYFILLIPEIILPGLVSSHLSLKYLLTIVFILGLIYSLLNSKQAQPETNPKFRSVSQNILNILLFLIFVMLLLSLYKMKFWEVVLLSALSLLIFISLKNILFLEKESINSNQTLKK